MAFGINEALAAGNQGGSKHLVYVDNVKVRYPNKDKDLFVAILPALADANDKSQYLPYREDDNEAMFTKWAAGFFYYPFVNKETSIISPKSFDSEAFDPIEELIKLAKRDARYARLAGFEEDGKTRIKNAYKDPDCRIPSRSSVFIMNGLILFDREVSQDEPHIVQVSATAFAGRGASSKDKGGNQSWGLIAELNRRNRNVSEDAEIGEKYYWGDITDPRGMQPCVCKLAPPPGGGVPIYNMTPVDDEDAVKTGKSVLEGRYNFDEILYRPEEGEIIEHLVKFYADVPELLKRAFAHRIPNFERQLKSATKVVSNGSEDSYDDGDDIPMNDTPAPARRRATRDEPPAASEEETVSKESERSFAPQTDDDDLPAPKSRKTETKAVDVGDPEDDGDDQPMSSIPERKVRATEGAAKRAGKVRSLLD